MGLKQKASIVKIGLAALAIAAIGGCRVKSVDSYLSATTADIPGSVINDPYSYGGTAYATGGLMPATTYGTGARGENDGALDYFTLMSRMAINGNPTWTVEGDPPNEKSGQFLTPWIGRVKDAAGSPFGTLSGY